jgi:hypothetical protein
MEQKKALGWSNDKSLIESDNNYSNKYNDFRYRVIDVVIDNSKMERLSRLDFTDNTQECFTPDGRRFYKSLEKQE